MRAWSMVLAALVLIACDEPPADAARADGVSPFASAAVSEPAPALVRAVPHGEMIELGLLGDGHLAERPVRAWLPPSFHSERAYPVVFVLDGQAESSLRVTETVEELLFEETIEPWVVVLVDSGPNRRRELAEHAERTADFLQQTVVPALGERVSVRAGASSTAILGYSYGGLAALRASVHLPAAFGRVVAMSPSLWWRHRLLVRELPEERNGLPLRVWVDAGTSEGEPRDTVPSMVEDVRALRRALLARGMVFGRDLGGLEAVHERHDFGAAGRRMREALAFALSDTDYAALAPSEVSIFVYPSRRNAVWQTYAVEARYGGARRLTWPPSEIEIEVRGGERELLGDLVRRLDGAQMLARVHGVESTAVPSSP